MAIALSNVADGVMAPRGMDPHSQGLLSTSPMHRDPYSGMRGRKYLAFRKSGVSQGSAYIIKLDVIDNLVF